MSNSVRKALASHGRTGSGFSIWWKMFEEVKLFQVLSRFNHRSESRTIGRVDGYDVQAEAK